MAKAAGLAITAAAERPSPIPLASPLRAGTAAEPRALPHRSGDDLGPAMRYFCLIRHWFEPRTGPNVDEVVTESRAASVPRGTASDGGRVGLADSIGVAVRRPVRRGRRRMRAGCGTACDGKIGKSCSGAAKCVLVLSVRRR